MALPAESNILESEGDCLFVFGVGMCILAHTQEIVEGYIDEVGFGQLERVVSFGSEGLMDKVFGQGDWHSELRAAFGVLFAVAVDLLFQGLAIFGFAMGGIEGVGESSHLMLLADGA